MSIATSFKSTSIALTLLLTAATGRAEDPSALIKRGDVCDQKFQASEALKYYLPAEKQDPKNVHILVCVARQYRHLMTDSPSCEDKLKLGKLALDYSQRAAALAPDDSDAQLSPGITYGKMLPFQGRSEQVKASPLIKESADKALQINPRNDLAWHLLGRWHQGLANVGTIKRALGQFIYGKLPTSTNEEAVECFNKAIEINPHALRHYIELGRTYAQMGQSSAAKRYISKGLAMPATEKDDSEMKARGRETLAKLE